MCGRFVSATPPDQLAAYFDAALAAPELAASYNVAPTNDVYAVVQTAQGRQLEAVHWGLVPSWAKDVKLGQKMINARADTLATKSAFKTSFAKRRCIIPADGFYEWQVVPGRLTARGTPAKQPMFIHRADGAPLAFAGLWAVWRDPAAGPEAPWLHSATIITTDANAVVAPVHDRMPAILAPDDWEAWLDPDHHDLAELQALLGPAPDDVLVLHPVSTAVNNVRNKGPELADPVDPSMGDEPEATGTLF